MVELDEKRILARIKDIKEEIAKAQEEIKKSEAELREKAKETEGSIKGYEMEIAELRLLLKDYQKKLDEFVLINPSRRGENVSHKSQ